MGAGEENGVKVSRLGFAPLCNDYVIEKGMVYG